MLHLFLSYICYSICNLCKPVFLQTILYICTGVMTIKTDITTMQELYSAKDIPGGHLS